MEIENIFLDKHWETISYNEALDRQKELCEAKKIGFLFFSPRPTLTAGIRAQYKDLLLSKEDSILKGFEIVETKRGGQWTYHGPGQVVVFPFGSLELFGYSNRAVREFICDFQKACKKFLKLEITSDIQSKEECVLEDDSIWLKNKKIGSIGMGFHRNSISHGIALNLDSRVLEGFSLINPCGISSEKIGFVFDSKKSLLQIKEAAYSFFK
jgi:lipoate-protein ligase B